MAMAIIITDIMNITVTKKSKIVPRFIIWIVAWLALMLFLFALPSFFARMKMLSGDSIQPDVLAGKHVSPQDLDKLEASRRSVVGWFAHRSIPNDLTMVAITRAQQDEIQAPKHFAYALAWQERALADAPLDPYGWFRLAFLYHQLDGPSQRAARAWQQSLQSGPYEPAIDLGRIDLGIKLGIWLDEAGQFYLQSLIRGQSEYSDEGLARVALQGRYVSRVEAVLADNEAQLTSFRLSVSEMLRRATRPALRNGKTK